ncbi:hypothetical protein M2137_001555 [Parabacteroides sp. PFB2-10]|uniref:DUF3822 family protein n=1 Tax=Parabacteroides sp. PFB2-10 TaxID=1742405 RepID=UPI002473DB2F|nr:DUF3822 family protein [Parabacteroides sp. PFB2-10]MDH6312780.1 hypothetical protein [Parabacteroides sp. PFB2-10]
MLISVPDTLTINQSDKYIMSIRLQPDGLSFSAYMPSVPGSFFIRKAEFDHALSYGEAFKEFFYAHDFLTWSYRKVYFVVDFPQFTMVPAQVFDEKQQEEFLAFNFSQPENRCLHNTLEEENMVVVYGMDNDTYEFCSRSFIDPLFVHSASLLIPFWKKQSMASFSANMFAVISPKRIDVFCYRQDKPVFINSFSVGTTEDILYYLLYIWRSTGMDQYKDQLFIYGEGGKGQTKQEIIEALNPYLRRVEAGGIPADAYLLGDEIMHTPVDLIALSTCES